MAARRALAAALALGAAAGASASGQWGPAEGLRDLAAVEEALHKVGDAKLTAEQKKVATRVVQDVEHSLAEINTDQNLTKAVRQQKLKAAIQELQGLKSQWELAAVEGALKKVVQTPSLSPEQATKAKAVVAAVDSIAKDMESGKLKGDALKAKLAFAIHQLQGLAREWSNVTVGKLEKGIAEKQARLKETREELKRANLEKVGLEKMLASKKLVQERGLAEARAKQQHDDAAERAAVSKLAAAARALAGGEPFPGNGTRAGAPGAPLQALDAILAGLKQRAREVSESIRRLEAEEREREAELTASMEAAQRAPKQGKDDALAKGGEMLKVLAQQERRSYRRTLAARESELHELEAGIRSIETRDVKTLSALVGKMQVEAKALQIKGKRFLH